MSQKRPTYEFIPSENTDGKKEFALRKPPAPNYTLHIVLFIITFVTTTIAGIGLSGVHVGGSFFNLFNPRYFSKGLTFSIPLMLILGTHEMGHYILSKIHRVKATLPYFIPAPTIIGTFGAFIKMKSPIYTKRALLDIGAAGPVAGFIVSIPAVIIGLRLSKVVPTLNTQGVQIGSSLLMEFLALLFTKTPPPGYDLMIHPIGFAGWIGLFVTSLNLIPIGQLDGGHVAYALFGEKSSKLAHVLLFGLVVMGIWFWPGWLFWALIIYFLGTKHPPAAASHIELDRPRKILALSMLIIFILTFIPTPFTVQM